MNRHGTILATLQPKNDTESEIIMVARWRTISFLGNNMPEIPYWLKGYIRNHLNQHYCEKCGEYIYNPYPNRIVRHYHYHTQRYNTILYNRIIVHSSSSMLEWGRRFPRVLRLMLSKQEIEAGITKVRANRMLASRMWTTNEWNLLYPQHRVDHIGSTKLTVPPKELALLDDTLFTPDIVL
jgi:hypothetical protein